MCVYSMVHDHFIPKFPNTLGPASPPVPYQPSVEPYWPPAPVTKWPELDLDQLEKLIKDWKEAAETAQKVDTRTKQPNCVDPEKEKLSKRIVELEAQLEKAKRALRLKKLLKKPTKLEKKYLKKK